MAKILNYDHKIRAGRKAPKITTKELEFLLLDYMDDVNTAYRKMSGDTEDAFEDISDFICHFISGTKDEFEEACEEYGVPVNQTLIKDRKYDYEGCNYSDEDRGCCGFQTLDNGFTYFGWFDCGDEEFSVFNILYWDGKELRMYQPTVGNAVNTKDKRALSFTEEDDYEYLRKYGVDMEEDEWPDNDITAMIKDIKTRITVV